MKIIFILFFFLFVGNAYAVVNSKNFIYTGDEIYLKFKKIQEFTTDYEVEGGGPILDNEIRIYSIDSNGQCVIVSKIDGDSGVYGTEMILYFSKSKALYGYRCNYSYGFIDGESSKKIDELNYSEKKLIVGKAELEKYFHTYQDYFNNKTQKNCI